MWNFLESVFALENIIYVDGWDWKLGSFKKKNMPKFEIVFEYLSCLVYIIHGKISNVSHL